MDVLFSFGKTQPPTPTKPASPATSAMQKRDQLAGHPTQLILTIELAGHPTQLAGHPTLRTSTPTSRTSRTSNAININNMRMRKLSKAHQLGGLCLLIK
jgi:hypothetical protein